LGREAEGPQADEPAVTGAGLCDGPGLSGGGSRLRRGVSGPGPRPVVRC
jgi:hypothetical protein